MGAYSRGPRARLGSHDTGGASNRWHLAFFLLEDRDAKLAAGNDTLRHCNGDLPPEPARDERALYGHCLVEGHNG